MVIYIVRVSASWHNWETTDLTYAYKDKQKAICRLGREINCFKREMVKKGREIEDCRVETDNAHFCTTADDYVDMWIEKIRVVA